MMIASGNSLAVFTTELEAVFKRKVKFLSNYLFSLIIQTKEDRVYLSFRVVDEGTVEMFFYDSLRGEKRAVVLTRNNSLEEG